MTTSHPAAGTVAGIDTALKRPFDWGSITWLFSGQSAQDAEQTLGYVVIEAGQKNPLHAHPNCEEVLYLISGELEHSLDGALYRLKPGDAIRVPAGAKHDARSLGGQPATMVVCYSDPNRQIVDYETPATAAPRE
jgi:quercetin dioxygenase-like cupin family protein